MKEVKTSNTERERNNCDLNAFNMYKDDTVH